VPWVDDQGRFGVTLKITGIDGARNRFRVTAEHATDLRPLWPKIEAYLRAQFAKQFATEGGALGSPWEPLDADYAAEKAAQGLKGILVQTGGLRASYLGQGRWTVSERKKDSLTVGSRHPLAHLHHHGTQGGRVPARPVLRVTPAMRREVKRMIRDYIVNG
jgi:phage gpG-like protein